MELKKKVPEVRFNGFSGEWVERQLGDESEIIAGGTPSTAISSYWEPKELPWMSSGEINKKRVFETDNLISKEGFHNSSARWIKKCSVLIALAGQGKTRGTVAINFIPLTTNQSIAAIIPTENINHEFLFQNLGKRYEELRTKSSGDGSRGGLNKQIISEIKIECPNITEQSRIGTWFQHLDQLITLHQKKYNKLTNIKKAMLEKMFPKNGADVPEIRFEGFEGKWEEREVNDIADRYDNLRVPITSTNRIPGNTPYYGANGIQDYVKGYTHNGDFILIAEDGANDLKNYPVQYVKGQIWVNNHAHVLQAKMQIADNKFLKYAFSQISFEPILVGGGRAKLNAQTMMKIKISFSLDIKEQQKIGTYFQKLDQLITLEQTQIDKLKNIKKACLEKMFV